MSLQDDYFDLESTLKGENKKKFLRIWETFIDMEKEYEDLIKIKSAVKNMIELTFKDQKHGKL